MFNISEYRQHPDRITDLLPWAALVGPGCVLNKDGSIQRSIVFRGPDVASSTETELIAITSGLNNAFKRLGSSWAFYFEAHRSQAQGYPEKAYFPDQVSQLIDLERKVQFNQEQYHFESRYHLTLQYMPPRESLNKVSQYFFSNHSPLKSQSYAKQLDYFKIATERFLDILKDYLCESKFLDDEGTLTYLHHCISENSHAITMPETPMYLDGLIADTPLTGGLSPLLGEHFLKTISILGFPSHSVPAILDRLNQLPLEYRWVTRFISLDKIDAEKELKSYKKKWFAKRKGVMTMLSEMITKGESAMVDNSAVKKSNDADMALQELEEDHVSFGYFTATVTVMDKEENLANEKIREVERVINGLGFATIKESFNALEAWLSSLPGHAYANIRAPLIHTLNLAHMIPFSAVWAGPLKNEHLNAPPLLYASTQGCTPFRLVNHIGDVGHQMIIGPTGSGKSVLLNMMALQFLRYKNANVVIFDKGGSFLASSMGVNGAYYEVGHPDAKKELLFQPLRHIDNEVERVWASDWVASLFAHEKIEITSEIKNIIWEALTNLANVPIEQRTLTGLQALLQHHELRQALNQYTLNGPYGNLLDNDHEVFTQHHWQCFELEALMDIPEIIPPILSYLFHKLESQFNGQPFMLVLDEAWLFLDHPIFRNKIKAWLKTLRKHNVSVIFATQSTEDILNSKVVNTLLESCYSRIFLPNVRILEPNIKESYMQLGLNERQIQIIANAIPKRQYYFESTQGTSLFDLELGSIALAFSAVSTKEDKKRIKSLLKVENYHTRIQKYLAFMGIESE